MARDEHSTEAVSNQLETAKSNADSEKRKKKCHKNVGQRKCYDENGRYIPGCRKPKRFRLPKWIDMKAKEFYQTNSLGWDELEIVRTKSILAKQLISARLGVDPPMNEEFPEFWDDIIYTEDQLDEIIALESNTATRKKRNIIKDSFHYWGVLAEIPYLIDDGYSPDQIAMIHEAMDYWQQDTCMKFIPYTEDMGETSLVVITKFGSGSACSSFVGRKEYNQAQDLSLKDNCFGKIGTIIHELGHLIGLYHQHQRPDKDTYIDNFPDNMQDYKKFWFEPKDASTLLLYNLPYDYSSTMHYWTTAFSNGNGPTIASKDPLYTKNMGQRTYGPTFYDAKAVNNRYDCTLWGCVGPDIECFNGGYQDYNDCATCRCPKGLTGDCTVPGPNENQLVCQPPNIRQATTTEQCFTFDGGAIIPGKFEDVTCSWMIQGSAANPQFEPIQIWFSEFNLAEDAQCDKMYVEVQYQGLDKRGPWFCGTDQPPLLQATSHPVLITFNSLENHFVDGAGFTLCYKLFNLPFQSG